MTTSWTHTPAAARLIRVRSAMVTNPSYAFFGCLVMRLRLVEASWLETMATDGDSLFYNAAWVESLSEQELLAVLVHEIFHLARFHHCRRGGRDLKEWNVATDLSINADVKALGLKLPGEMLFDPAFAGLGAEEIYRLRESARPTPPPCPEPEPEPDQDQDQDDSDPDQDQDGGDAGQDGDQDGDQDQDGQGDGQDGGDGQDQDGDGQGDQDGQDASSGSGNGQGDGQGQGDQDGDGQGSGDGQGQDGRAAPDPGRCGGILDAAPDPAGMKDAQAEMESAVRQAVSVAKAANAGTLPGFLERLLDDLNAPRVSWRDVMADFIDDAATRSLDWSRPNKRFLDSGFTMPGSVKDSVRKIAAVVDTSGSIDARTLAVFRDELQGILDSGRVESLAVVFCHHAVSGDAEYSAGDIIKLDVTETGGTLFGPAFRHIAAHHEDAAAVVYLTDLDPAPVQDGFGPDPGLPVLWTVLGPRRACPFGEVIPIDANA